jgi:hypothetical protein
MATKKTAAKKTAAKKTAVKKKSPLKKTAKKKGGNLKSITLKGDHSGVVKTEGGPHMFTLGGPHMLIAPKGQKIGKIRIVKDGADLSLTFEK